MQCFTADILRFFTEKRQNLAFGWAAGYFAIEYKDLEDFLHIF